MAIIGLGNRVVEANAYARVIAGLGASRPTGFAVHINRSGPVRGYDTGL